jgi:hypothetical protein
VTTQVPEWEAEISGDAMGDPFATSIDEETAQAAFEQSTDIGTESLKAPPRGTKAKLYERKVNKFFSKFTRATLGSPNAIPDSATVIKYGPDVAEKAGDLAARDEGKWLATAIDYFDGTADNPTLAFVAAALPMFLQLLRNHEPIEVKETGIKIPFTKKRIPVHFHWEMPTFWRNLTQAPDVIANEVFTHPEIQKEIKKQGLRVANANSRRH